MASDRLTTLADLPFHVAGRFPRPGFIGRALEQGVQSMSGKEFFERIRDLSLGLRALGLQAGDRVAIISESRPEWTLSDLAILTAGGITVPIYPTLSAAQCRYILNDSGAKFAIASTDAQAAKIEEARAQTPALQALIVMERDPAPAVTPAGVSLADVEARGHQVLTAEWGAAREFKERAGAIRPDEVATIIYTSGTTGDPKGVMLTHDNIVSNILATLDVLELAEDDTALSFLPLSHSFERMVLYLYLYKGVSVTFAETLETVARDIPRVRPSVMTAVPRVYEKLHARVREKAAQASALRRRIFEWAVRVGTARARVVLAGRRPSALLTAQARLADRLVFAKIREGLGGRIRYLVSGSAPLPRDIGEFFYAAGLLIVEGYGLTETSPVLTVNPQNAPRFGTVGRAIPGVELRIAGDGEILARGPNVMRGYWNKPEETAEVLKDGWFHTGDIGSIDTDGYLTITDRKKDILVTAGGKNVAPQPIEAQLKASGLVAEAVLFGDRRRFVAALLVPAFPGLEARLRELGRDGGPPEALVRRPDVVALYEEIVAAVNRDLAQYEQIKRFELLPAEFSIAGGELTPTLKVKRRVIEERWKDAIERLYA